MLKTTLIAFTLTVAAAPAAAQRITPAGVPLDQLPNGIVRGIEAENSSGQVGEFAIFPGTRVIVVRMNGASVKAEAVAIHRGQTCGPVAGQLVATLGTLRQGHLTATSPLPISRLLSGNYNIVAHNNTPTSSPVGCGHIYR
jgi:hypothetical protein